MSLHVRRMVLTHVNDCDSGEGVLKDYIGHITLDELLLLREFDEIIVNWLPPFHGVTDIQLNIRYGAVDSECILSLQAHEITQFSEWMAEVVNR